MARLLGALLAAFLAAVAASEDGATLLKLRENFGDAFPGGSTWLVGTNDPDPCPWAYVTCEDGRVSTLNLAGLNIVGTLSSYIGDLLGLQVLLLSGNKFYGDLPSSVGKLTQLHTLDASANNFSGFIPETLGGLPQLATLRLANNSFEKPIPPALQSKFCYDVFAGNPAVEGLSSANFPPCSQAFVAAPPPPLPPSRLNVAAVAGGAVGGAVLVLLAAALLAFLLLRSRHRVEEKCFISEEDLREIEEGLEKLNLSAIRRFTLDELRRATSDWAAEIGSGASSTVYRGDLPALNGEPPAPLAVKRLKVTRVGKDDMAAFCNEIDTISRAVHRNVVRLAGYCLEEGEMILVFPFMENGSVEDHLRGHRLHNRRPLSLVARHQIALGAARGLMYLHEECSVKVIHRDVKAANVLLTAGMEAVLTDFGLARVTEGRQGATGAVQTKVRGTFGHMAPEYVSTGRLSEKADVYAYGVFLLEMVTGLPAASLSQKLEAGQDLKDWLSQLVEEDRVAEVVDLEVRVKFLELEDGELKLAEIVPLVQVAVLCLIPDPAVRPSMAECLRLLQGEGLLEAREKIRQEVPESVLSWNPSFGAYSSLSASLLSFMTDNSFASDMAVSLPGVR